MKKITSLFVVAAAAINIYAEGYQVNLQSAKQTGMGHVGAALKLGAESMHFNPAGMGFMQSKMDISVGASAIFSKATYDDNNGYTAETDNDVSTPLFVYASFSLTDKLKAGVSVTTPYGSSINWGKDWAGDALVQDIALKAFVYQPTLSYRITDKLSVGAGLMLANGNVELRRKVAVFGANVEGNSELAFGYNLGLMYDISSKWSVGASYRSKINLEVEEGDISLVGPLTIERKFSSELPLPSNLNIGASFKPNEKLLLSAEFQYVGWSAYEKLVLTFDNAITLPGLPALSELSATKNYENSYAIRLGGQYALCAKMDLRAGIYFDSTPIQENFYNPETPGMNKLGISAGISYRPMANLSIDAAFLTIQGLGKDGLYPATSMTQQFEGSYTSTAYIPTIGISYSF